jgi:hypothetical protein
MCAILPDFALDFILPYAVGSMNLQKVDPCATRANLANPYSKGASANSFYQSLFASS